MVFKTERVHCIQLRHLYVNAHFVFVFLAILPDVNIPEGIYVPVIWNPSQGSAWTLLKHTVSSQ